MVARRIETRAHTVLISHAVSAARTAIESTESATADTAEAIAKGRELFQFDEDSTYIADQAEALMMKLDALRKNLHTLAYDLRQHARKGAQKRVV